MITQAYFDKIRDHIINEIEQAQHYLIIAVAWFTDQVIFSKLLEKARQGVLVELMLCNDEINQHSKINFHQLEKVNGKLYFIGGKDSDTLMHNKFCVIDFKVVINGSYNWSNKAQQNHENITISSQAEVLALQFTREFNRVKQLYYKEATETLQLDIPKMIQRLQVIKNLIGLDEQDVLSLQISRLKTFRQLNEVIDIIIIKLENRSWGAAINKIEEFIRNYEQLTIYINPEIEALKLEAKSLEIRLTSLSDELADLDRQLHLFTMRHAHELGALILEFLQLKKQLAESKEQAKEAEEAYQAYEKDLNETKGENVYALSTDEQMQLKQAYRKASKLCHPDAVNKEQSAIAHELFIKLNIAYQRNDLFQVNTILDSLIKGQPFKSNAEILDKKQQLLNVIADMHQKIITVLERIARVKKNKDYNLISDSEKWDSYFTLTKKQLIQQIAELKHEYRQAVN